MWPCSKSFLCVTIIVVDLLPFNFVIIHLKLNYYNIMYKKIQQKKPKQIG